MNVALRPGEVSRRVIVKVKPTYPNQKDLGGYRVDLFTNREGGVEIPFSMYAISSNDPDLEFFDIETGEPLGHYEPPDEVDKSGKNSMDELASAIRLLVEHGFNVESSTKVLDSDESNSHTKEDLAIAEDTLNILWRDRIEAVKDIDSDSVKVAMIHILESKANIGKTNKNILEYLKIDSGEEEEEAVVIEVNDGTEDLDYSRIPKAQVRIDDEPMINLTDL